MFSTMTKAPLDAAILNRGLSTYEKPIQALLDAPMFPIRWRWNASRSLALLRWRGGKRVPPRLQRMQAEDLISAQAFDGSQAQLRMKQASVEVLRKRIAQQQAMLASSLDDLEKTTVVAPMDGVVTRLDHEEGEVVIGAQSFSPTVTSPRDTSSAAS